MSNYVLNRSYPDGATHTVEYLLLVNGKDDDNNGYVDDGWDGVDNNGNGQVDELEEWEIETWIGAGQPADAPPSPLASRHSEYVLHHHPAAGGVAGIPRDAAAIECGG